jgi:hypothetical protein
VACGGFVFSAFFGLLLFYGVWSPITSAQSPLAGRLEREMSKNILDGIGDVLNDSNRAAVTIARAIAFSNAGPTGRWTGAHGGRSAGAWDLGPGL